MAKRVSVTNLYSDEVGNPQLPKKFLALKKHRSHVGWAEVAIALLVLAAVIAAFLFFCRRTDAIGINCRGKEYCSAYLRESQQ